MRLPRTSRPRASGALVLVVVLAAACGSNERRVHVEPRAPAPVVSAAPAHRASVTEVLAPLGPWFDGLVWQAAAEPARIAALIPLTRDWDALHRCEQADTWWANGFFGNGLHGGGGLGMSDGAWDIGVRAARARGVDLPAHSWEASIIEQKWGGQAFYDATNGGGWACPI